MSEKNKNGERDFLPELQENVSGCTQMLFIVEKNGTFTLNFDSWSVSSKSWEGLVDTVSKAFNGETEELMKRLRRGADTRSTQQVPLILVGDIASVKSNNDGSRRVIGEIMRARIPV